MNIIRRAMRTLVRTTLLIAGPVAIAIGGLYFYMSSGRYVTTENAYVKADLIIVTAEVSGRVTEVMVDENDIVEPGQVLFRIDQRRFKVERDRRAAEVGAARQRIEAQKARYRTKQAELAAAIRDAEFMREDLARFEQLGVAGTISQTRLLETRREAAKAEAQIDVIREEIEEVRAELSGDPGIPTDHHPEVQRAISEQEQAELDLLSTSVTAPAYAIAANLHLQVGEYVEEGDPVLSLVSSEGFWVEANLKETDLTHLRIGQDAVLHVDAYPDAEWHALVDSLSPATGAEYAILPPQNASGNWVKVVQRIPVRIKILPNEDAPPLRAGMSVAVSIDTEFERPLPDVLDKAQAWIAQKTGE